MWNGWTEPSPGLTKLLELRAPLIELLFARSGSTADFEHPERFRSDGYLVDVDSGMRFARLLLLSGRKLAFEGRDDEALERFLATLRFGHRHVHERGAPLIATLAGWGLQREAVPCIQAPVHRSRTSEAAWRDAVDELRDAPDEALKTSPDATKPR